MRGGCFHMNLLGCDRWYLERIQQAVDKARLECGSDQACPELYISLTYLRLSTVCLAKHACKFCMVAVLVTTIALLPRACKAGAQVSTAECWLSISVESFPVHFSRCTWLGTQQAAGWAAHLSQTPCTLTPRRGTKVGFPSST